MADCRNFDNLSSFDTNEIPPGIENIDLNEKKWDLASNYADEIHMYHVLEHLPDTAAVVNEVRRVLKPGGLFIGEVPYGRSYGSIIHWQHCHHWVADTFRIIAQHFKFEVIEAKNDRVSINLKRRIRNLVLPGRFMEILGHPDAYDVVRFTLKKPSA